MTIFWSRVSLVAALFAVTAGGVHAAQPAGGDPAAGFPGKPIRWVSLGVESAPTTPGQFDKLIAEDIAALTKLARASNVKAD